MADQQLQSQLIEATRSSAAVSNTPPTALSSASDSKGTSFKPARRRRSSSQSPADASGNSRESPKQRQRTKTMPYRAGSGSASGPSKGSLVTLPGAALDAMGGEITYTPTTHRISKAKKGKKVHACEYPGCPKVRLVLNRLRDSVNLQLDIHAGRASQVWRLEVVDSRSMVLNNITDAMKQITIPSLHSNVLSKDAASPFNAQTC